LYVFSVGAGVAFVRRTNEPSASSQFNLRVEPP
jgi:hypothetical protein